MKALLTVILLSLPLAAYSAADVQLGDSLKTVRSALGVPRGQVKIGGRHLLYYDRGEVELRSGTVARVELRSPDEQAVFAAQRAASDQRMSEENARLLAEGSELKARKLSDDDFRAAPLGYQVAFWESFAARYSGVSCSEQLTVARLRLAEQQQLEVPYAPSETPEAMPDEPAYVIPYGRSYLNRFGYGRNNFALPSVHRFSNPLLSFHRRSVDEVSRPSDRNRHHTGVQLGVGGGAGAGTRIRR